MNNKIDWDQIEVFLALMDHGTQMAAAAQLGISQPTLGRKITALEDQIGQPLFTRGRMGMTPTAAALQLVQGARAMAQAAGDVSAAVFAQKRELHGTVRITASEVVATYILPKILGPMLQSHRDLEVEVVGSNTTDNLLSREADIAVRMFEPTQDDVISMRLGGLNFGLFAHASYLEQHGMIRGFDDLQGHIMVGYDKSNLMIDGMRRLGVEATSADFRVRTDGQASHVEYLRAGIGIVATQCGVAKTVPDVVQILPQLAIPPLPVYLAAHNAVKHDPAVRVVYDVLNAGLRNHIKNQGL
ncbi:MAG: LysR family transcriptional regulator [Planktomarina sp.]